MTTRLLYGSAPACLLAVFHLACSTPTEISNPVMADLTGVWESDSRELVSLLEPGQQDRSTLGYPECDFPEEPVPGEPVPCRPRPMILTVVPDTATSNLPGVIDEYGICTTRWIRSDGDTLPIEVGSVVMEALDAPDRSIIRLTCAFGFDWRETRYTFRLTDRTLELTHTRVLTRSWAEDLGFTVPDSLDQIEARETLRFDRVH